LAVFFGETLFRSWCLYGRCAIAYPAHGQLRASNELRKLNTFISPGGVRSIWLRHDLHNFKLRLKALEEKVAQENTILTEEQVAALEKKKQDDVACGEIETAHPGYLGSQDTFYVGNLKGVGRIYQQTFVDTYSKIAFAKLYTIQPRRQLLRLMRLTIKCCLTSKNTNCQCSGS